MSEMNIIWTDYIHYRMNKSHIAYFEKDDVLHYSLTDEPETNSLEISHDITAELNERGELIGIEILNVSRFLRDVVMDSIQAKMLDLTAAKAS